MQAANIQRCIMHSSTQESIIYYERDAEWSTVANKSVNELISIKVFLETHIPSIYARVKVPCREIDWFRTGFGLVFLAPLLF